MKIKWFTNAELGAALADRKSRIAFINNSLLPLAKSDLSTAKFNYGECANIGFRRKKPIDLVIHDEGVLNCEPFEKKVQAAHLVVKNLQAKVRTLSVAAGMAHSDFQKERLMEQIEDIQNNQLPPAREKVNAATTALDDCKRKLPHDVA